VVYGEVCVMIKPIECEHRWEATFKGSELNQIDPLSIHDVAIMFNCLQIKCRMCGIQGQYTSKFYAKVIKYFRAEYDLAERQEQDPLKPLPVDPELAAQLPAEDDNE